METLSALGKRKGLIAIAILLLLLGVVSLLVLKGQTPYTSVTTKYPPLLITPISPALDEAGNDSGEYQRYVEEWATLYAIFIPQLYEDLVKVHEEPNIINDLEWLDRHTGTMDVLMEVSDALRKTIPPERFNREHEMLSSGARRVITSINRYAEIKIKTNQVPAQAFDELNEGVKLLNRGFESILGEPEQITP